MLVRKVNSTSYATEVLIQSDLNVPPGIVASSEATSAAQDTDQQSHPDDDKETYKAIHKALCASRAQNVPFRTETYAQTAAHATQSSNQKGRANDQKQT